MVVVSAEAGQPTVRSQQEARRALENDVRADPLVQAVLANFRRRDRRRAQRGGGVAAAGREVRRSTIFPDITPRR